MDSNKKSEYQKIATFDDGDDHAIIARRSWSRAQQRPEEPEDHSCSYPIITSSIVRGDADEDELVQSISNQIARIGSPEPVLPIRDESGPQSRPLAARIPFFGLICSMLSVFCYSVASLIVKILTDLHALEILGIRSLFQIAFYFTTTWYYSLPFFGSAGQRLDIALRAIFGTIAAITIYMSYRLIPLADASTIQFSAPVFVFILGYFILGERVTIAHILTGLIALVGVVFVSKPKFILQHLDPSMLDEVNYEGIVLALIACISTAFGMIMLRKLKHTPVQVVVLWFSVATAVSAFVALYFVDRFVWPSGGWREWAWLVGIGFAGIGDQLFMTLAFKYESAGVVSVSRTMTIVLAFVWDTLILSVSVHWTSILGSCLVTVAVLILAIARSLEGEQGVWDRVKSKLCCGRGKATVQERAKLLAG